MRWLRYVFRELLNNRRFSFLFVLNLSMGLTGFVALDGFKVSLDHTIRGRSKAVLGGDFGLSARRPLGDDERAVVEGAFEGHYKSSAMVEMFSMIANSQRRSRLVQIKAVEDNYPFYGDVILRDQGVLTPKLHEKLKAEPRAWIYPELLRQLNVKVGDKLYIGETQFVVDDVIKEDAAAGISTNMAPRIYINKVNLQKTGLMKKGSIAWHSVIYKLPGRQSETLDQYRDTIFKILDSPEVRVYTHENVSQQMTALITRLNDFLGLSSLVALFLAAVGSAFLFRSYFQKRLKQMATLLCLGASRRLAFSYYVIQIVCLGFVSSLVAIVLGFLIVPGLGALTQDLLPFQVEFQLAPWTLAVGIAVGTLGSLAICFPLLATIKDLRPSLLLVADNSANQRLSLWVVLASVPLFALFWWMAVWLSHSYKIGSLFTVIFLAAGLLLGGGAILLFRFLEKAKKWKSLSLRWALRDLSRKRLTTLAGFVAIGLGALLLNIIPQLQKSLQSELEQPQQSKLPSLFMFDIQEEQLDDFHSALKKENVEVDFISPMIRARLVKVNDRGFDKGQGLSDQFTREEEREMRFRNRGFNLSYRGELSEAESLVAGESFSGIYKEGSETLPEISVEKRFAERLGLQIGDVLEFEIESIPITGKIVNLRSIRWTSFRPNFFVQFQPGVLEMAPKTYVATLPHVGLEKKHQLQDRLVQNLPNVSMVDVSRIVERISGIMVQMSWALAFMSFLCLLAGFIVIYSIANHQATSQTWEVGLLKALGAPFPAIRNQFFWQFGLLSFTALSLGATVSLAVSYYLSTLLFESLWVFDWKTPALTIVLGTLVTLLVTHLATRGFLGRSTQQLFSEPI